MKTRQYLSVLITCATCVAAANLSAATAAPSMNPDTLTDAQRAKPVGPQSKGAIVLRAQVLLERAHFTSGEIDGSFGMNLRKAIAGYQKASDLTVTSTVDSATWAALNADVEPILASYTIIDKDVAGPFKPIPTGMADKAKLTSLGYANAAEALSEKFHVSPKLLAKLNPGKDFSKAGEEIIVPNLANAAPLAKVTKIIVDRANSTLSVLDASGKTIGQFPASTGSDRDPLPIGSWKVKSIARNPTFFYNPKLFWDASPTDTKAKIAAGPNNPVGVVWIDLTKEHYGIHGTPEPSQIGRTQSHGCIRLTNWDASALALAISNGVEVLMQE